MVHSNLVFLLVNSSTALLYESSEEGKNSNEEMKSLRNEVEAKDFHKNRPGASWRQSLLLTLTLSNRPHQSCSFSARYS